MLQLSDNPSSRKAARLIAAIPREYQEAMLIQCILSNERMLLELGNHQEANPMDVLAFIQSEDKSKMDHQIPNPHPVQNENNTESNAQNSVVTNRHFTEHTTPTRQAFPNQPPENISSTEGVSIEPDPQNNSQKKSLKSLFRKI